MTIEKGREWRLDRKGDESRQSEHRQVFKAFRWLLWSLLAGELGWLSVSLAPLCLSHDLYLCLCVALAVSAYSWWIGYVFL